MGQIHTEPVPAYVRIFLFVARSSVLLIDLRVVVRSSAFVALLPVDCKTSNPEILEQTYAQVETVRVTLRQPRHSESVRKALTLNHHAPGVTLILDLKSA